MNPGNGPAPRSVLITGASRGIGAATALAADVGDEAQVQAMFAAVDAQLGGLAALVNNAGVLDVAARVGSPSQYLDYSMSKAAIDHLTAGLAREVAAEGVRVNAVRPGIIATEIHARGGHGER